MKNRIFTVILYKEDDVYIAECPEIGTVDQGETIGHAIATIPKTFVFDNYDYTLMLIHLYLKVCKLLQG
ncbi:hypothetical protein RI030_07395 [Aphanizomenon flos-aquae NRERC-008]|jgi:hypothetical protein|uniref:type II toxin-antitoxin system HicB family antitoxin n=1 Tax=Aphanizomenon TaxID=1175 RepID=UPI001F557C00|nr:MULTISPECIES: hypothetical protein [Aphanizomenon]MCE2903576.1 hypothetical protein [Anabaena sp. CoA2_C59]MDJ0507202.1 hypothetical protein [Nostocales cyanobacterium LE14-WE12]MDS9397421.1 hypothetical protein [Aphanizomenon flos-aquae NRERC-008]